MTISTIMIVNTYKTDIDPNVMVTAKVEIRNNDILPFVVSINLPKAQYEKTEDIKQLIHNILFELK